MDSFDLFTITPMSSGDIIDRAVRLYRRNFLVLLRIVLGPSLIAYTGLIVYQVGLHNFSLMRGNSRLFLTILMILSGLLLYLIGTAAFFVVLGGVSRSLIYFFFDGTPLRARTVYQTVREKFWSLLLSTVVIILMIIGFVAIIYVATVIVILIFAAVAAGIAGKLPPWIEVTSAVIFGVVFSIILLGIVLMFWLRIIYVPQVLIVEGKGVFSSISRSFSRWP